MSTKRLPEAAAAFDAAVAEHWFPAAGAVAAAEVLGCSPVEALNALVAFGHVRVVMLDRGHGGKNPDFLWLQPVVDNSSVVC